MFIIENDKCHVDVRGSHTKFFERHVAQENQFGEVHEVFITSNNKNTLRGLHFQKDPFQQKIVKVMSGRFNVKIVSPYEISEYSTPAENYRKMGWFVYEFDDWDFSCPPLFAPDQTMLGYVALENNSKMLYLADAPFNASGDTGYSPIGAPLYLRWGVDELDLILSDKDKLLGPLPTK